MLYVRNSKESWNQQLVGQNVCNFIFIVKKLLSRECDFISVFSLAELFQVEGDISDIAR